MEVNTLHRPVDLLKDVESYVEDHIRRTIGPDYVYHNFQHTLAVVEAANELASHYELTEQELLTLRFAAWFHDTGYTEGWQDHEERSADYAEAFLREQGRQSQTLVQAVRAAILATRVPQEPRTLVQEILADADLSHLGEWSYWDRCGRVRQEFALTRQIVMSDQQWVDFELAFLLDHEYHTEAARELYSKQKERHVKELYRRKKALYPDPTPTNLAELERGQPHRKVTKKRSKTEPNKPGRGVETMYRATYRSQVNLSSMADSKANIMLSVNAIILSISAANLFPKLDTNPHLTVPTIILMGVCLSSLFFAIQATRPKVTEGKSSMEDIKAKRSNLLFFGNFYNMTLEEYEYGMSEMLQDEDFLYATMSRDLYYLGVVLAKKYAYLRVCYSVFLYGFITAVLAFIGAAVYYNMQATDTVPAGSSLFGL
ncbi:hypothetical protein LEM8419_01109 [Neolewinella maritima]|uniref:HD/PDEase domain-containing protein n=1 Tax=Neolewinella maritima TaxID=1383882 RepID=A0ABM9AYL3_9BACT|nr:Pycsar system effector family protein [Neolewinella maritima]CAH0999811.1 hypothetical protein LEM8419_01109 [Neolewinella maritima]